MRNGDPFHDQIVQIREKIVRYPNALNTKALEHVALATDIMGHGKSFEARWFIRLELHELDKQASNDQDHRLPPWLRAHGTTIVLAPDTRFHWPCRSRALQARPIRAQARY